MRVSTEIAEQLPSEVPNGLRCWESHNMTSLIVVVSFNRDLPTCKGIPHNPTWSPDCQIKKTCRTLDELSLVTCTHTIMEGNRFAHLLHPVTTKNLVRDWLKEDTPSFDYGGFVVGEKVEKAWLLCKSPGVLAGTPFFEALFSELDCSIKWFRNEGDLLSPVCKVAEVTGKVRNLLLGERVSLNCITRTSGIATFARQLKDEAERCNWHGEVAGTRKTTPGFRIPEKYALLVGGISTHRHDLSSMIMLKDNHIWSAGSITQAVSDAKRVGGFSSKIEVECRSVAEAVEAGRAGCDVVMLDNFDTKSLQEAAQQVKAQFPHLIVEASGGVTLETIKEYFGPHIDVISLSRTTQGYSTVDFSFKIQKDGKNPENPLVVM